MTKFTFKDKLSIILDYEKALYSQTEYAQLKNVTKAQFQYWLRLYEMHGVEGLKSTYTNYTTTI